MRIGFWKLFSTAALLTLGLYVFNPLGTASLDPRLRLFGITTFSIPANSMAPTISQGDLVFANAWPYALGNPQRGDLVVFRRPQLGANYLKRLIALPGERVAIRDGTVFINGKPLAEPYVNPDQSQARPNSLNMKERLVSENEFFMLGDNRHNSNDSRYWGTVPKANLIGKVTKL